MYLHSGGDHDGDINEGMPTMASKDGRTKMVYARVLPQKGFNE